MPAGTSLGAVDRRVAEKSVPSRWRGRALCVKHNDDDGETILWDHQSRSAFPPNPDRYHTVQLVKAGELAFVRAVLALKREHCVTRVTSQPPRRYWLKA